MEAKGPRIAITHDAGYDIEPYRQAVEAAGGEPVAVVPGDAVSMDEFDGLVIAGGVDVDPALYGEERRPETQKPNAERDGLELQLLGEALERDRPVLAICRGMQLFNVAAGGTLEQHMEGHERRTANKAVPAHAVRVEPGSRLAGLLETEEAHVNSRHHQAVKDPGAGLAVVALAPDGTVEALERADRRFAVAVQWHPENMAASDPVQGRLFRGFIAAARDAAR